MGGVQTFVAGTALAGISGLPGLCFGRNSPIGQRIATLLILVGNGLTATAAVEFLRNGPGTGLTLPSPLAGASFVWGFDSLSVFFLLPVCLVSSLSAIYGLDYWKQTEHPDNGRKLWVFFGLMTACMETVVVAQSSMLFLFAWEGMAVSAFFLISTDDQDEEARNAGWLFLGASHLATLCLFATFALMGSVTHTFGNAPDGTGWATLEAAAPAIRNAIFLTALLGFGLKAGIMPLHVWLPSAHAMAPSHVSAMMSGVFIKMGIYGLMRITSLFPQPPVWWGALLLVLGSISGIFALAFAIGQRDLKRLLAYSSIENIGIITIGIGLALVGRSLGQIDWVVLGMGGALLHVWNHACFKSMMFFCAGSIIHATHTRKIDLLGGLSKLMPRTALCFLIGAVAVCGLPPLNGFVSEFLIYMGLFQSLGIATPGIEEGPRWATAAFAAPALAFIGALAVACFVKSYGLIFLGTARTDHAKNVHESSVLMTGPMFVLAACCLTIGIVPTLVTPILESGIRTWHAGAVGPATRLELLAPLRAVSAAAIALVCFLVVASLLLRWRLGAGEITYGGTWGCGYLAPTARMQYTGSSFGEMLVKLFGWVLLPRISLNRPRGYFAPSASFESEIPDTLLMRAVLPVFRSMARLFSWFRLIQQGSIHAYLMYILVILVVLLLWR